MGGDVHSCARAYVNVCGCAFGCVRRMYYRVVCISICVSVCVQNNTALTIPVVPIFRKSELSGASKQNKNIKLLFLRPFITLMFQHYELLKAQSNTGFIEMEQD